MVGAEGQQGSIETKWIGLSCKSNNKDSSYCIVSRKRSKPLYMEQTKCNRLYLGHSVTSHVRCICIYLYICSKRLCIWRVSKVTGCSWSTELQCHFSMSLAYCRPFICKIHFTSRFSFDYVSFSGSGAACYFPVEVQGEFMTQSLAHQEISYTRFSS